MDEFEELRPRLFGIAYRILGSVVDAEDVVQDSWIAWQAVDRGEVDSAGGYLTRVVTNRCLNRLRDNHRRRESYIGPWLPEPLDTARRPDEAAELAESVSYALMVMLEQLTPLERAAFVLREAFDIPTAETAQQLGTTPAAVRQLVSRARRHLSARDRDREVDDQEYRRISEAFGAAVAVGDINAAASLLAPDIVLVTDGGGVRRAALHPIVGRDKVIRFWAGLLSANGPATIQAAQFNGRPGSLVVLADEVSVVQVRIEGGLVQQVWVVRNPHKLSDVRAVDQSPKRG